MYEFLFERRFCSNFFFLFILQGLLLAISNSMRTPSTHLRSYHCGIIRWLNFLPKNEELMCCLIYSCNRIFGISALATLILCHVNITAPKWIAPLLLLLDLYEMTAARTQRIYKMDKVSSL